MSKPEELPRINELIDKLYALDAKHPWLGQTHEPLPDERAPEPPSDEEHR